MTARLPYALDTYNDGIARARDAYDRENHCRCGAIVPPHKGNGRPWCDECRGLDTHSSASRQHYIETGEYLPEGATP